MIGGKRWSNGCPTRAVRKRARVRARHMRDQLNKKGTRSSWEPARKKDARKLRAKKLRPNPGYEPLPDSNRGHPYAWSIRFIDRMRARDGFTLQNLEATIPSDDPSQSPKSQPRRKTDPRKDFQKFYHLPKSNLPSHACPKTEQANVKKERKHSTLTGCIRTSHLLSMDWSDAVSAPNPPRTTCLPTFRAPIDLSSLYRCNRSHLQAHAIPACPRTSQSNAPPSYRKALIIADHRNQHQASKTLALNIPPLTQKSESGGSLLCQSCRIVGEEGEGTF